MLSVAEKGDNPGAVSLSVWPGGLFPCVTQVAGTIPRYKWILCTLLSPGECVQWPALIFYRHVGAKENVSRNVYWKALYLLVPANSWLESWCLLANSMSFRGGNSVEIHCVAGKEIIMEFTIQICLYFSYHWTIATAVVLLVLGSL